MEIATNRSFVLTELSSFEKLADLHAAIRHGEFYQVIAAALIEAGQIRHGYKRLGVRLATIAEHAYTVRRTDLLGSLSLAMLSLPLGSEFEGVGRYYQALSLQRFGTGELESATGLLEIVATAAPIHYRLRAMQSLGTNLFYKGDLTGALSFSTEATCFASRQRCYAPWATVVTQKDMAVIASQDGNHKGALALLENLLPLASEVRYSRPHIYCHYLNSLAVELVEAGRFEEAERACRVVLASPFAGAYPEWHETYRELEVRRGCRASRSSIAGSERVWASTNVLALPVRRRSDTTQGRVSSESNLEPARVLSFQARKDKMTEESIDVSAIREQIKRMSMQDKLLRLFQLASSEGLTAEQIDEILETAEIVIRKGGVQS